MTRAAPAALTIPPFGRNNNTGLINDGADLNGDGDAWDRRG
jgi:hypothetical protein